MDSGDSNGGKVDAAGSRSLFRHFDFLKFWSAETFSVFGVQFSSLAIPWMAATTLKAGPFEMGVLQAVRLRYLGLSLFSLIRCVG
jgi:hypothetical protein